MHARTNALRNPADMAATDVDCPSMRLARLDCPPQYARSRCTVPTTAGPRRVPQADRRRLGCRWALRQEFEAKDGSLFYYNPYSNSLILDFPNAGSTRGAARRSPAQSHVARSRRTRNRIVTYVHAAHGPHT